MALEPGLRAHDGPRVDRLSEGLYRRLLVAIRLLVLPSILCLDELTTGQDAGTALALTMGARQLARRGLAVVVVVHQPEARAPARLVGPRLVSNGLLGLQSPREALRAALSAAGFAPRAVRRHGLMLALEMVDQR